MKNFKKHILISICLTTLLATGCTIEGGEVIEEDKGKISVCTDTRDNTTFRFNTNTVNNIRRAISIIHSIDIVTLSGEKKTLTSDMQAWLKCVRE